MKSKNDGIVSVPNKLSEFPRSEKEILEAVEKALTLSGRPLRQTELRSHLEHVDPAFRKDQNLTVPGFIARIVRMAEDRGVIYVDRAFGQSNPAISLRRTPSSKGAHAHPVEIDPTHSGETSVAESISTETKAKIQRRSDRFFEILRQLDLGPFSVIRPKLYDAIENFANEKRLSCNLLIRRAVTQVREAVGDEYPWYPVTKFLFYVLGRKPVLLSEDNRKLNPNSLEDVVTVVCGVSADWRQELDAVLLETIIAEDKHIEAYDIQELAPVLFNSRDEDAQSRTETLLSRLQKDGRIRWDGNKTIQVVAAISDRANDDTIRPPNRVV